MLSVQIEHSLDPARAQRQNASVAEAPKEGPRRRRPHAGPGAGAGGAGAPLLLLAAAGSTARPIQLQEACSRLLAGDPEHISLAEAAGRTKPEDYRTDAEFAGMRCSQLVDGYWLGPVSQSELDYPIAFTVVTYRDFYQVNKLMQAIHRRHNHYCVHVDANSGANFTAAVRRLAGCLGNVLVVESKVVWGESSVLLADISCYRELIYGNKRWHYVINLTGQEYSIRTLNEIVDILRLMNGSNNMERLQPNGYVPYPTVANDSELSALRWYKGSAHAITSRAAVDYMLGDPRAHRILGHILGHFSRGRTVPDETFYATLNHNYPVLRFPGSYTGAKFTGHTVYRQIYRYKLWSASCKSGLSVRGICILGAADMADLNSRPELFANKFYYDFQSPAFACAQDRFWHNTLVDYNSKLSKTYSVPASFYAGLDFVRQHA